MRTEATSWRMWVVPMEADGRIVLPDGLRDQLGIQPKEALVLIAERDGLRIESVAAAIAEGQRSR